MTHRIPRGVSMHELLITCVLVCTIILMAHTLLSKQGHAAREASFSANDLSRAARLASDFRDDASRAESVSITPVSATFTLLGKQTVRYDVSPDGVLLRTPSQGEPVLGPRVSAVEFERAAARDFLRVRWHVGNGSDAGRLVILDVALPAGRPKP